MVEYLRCRPLGSQGLMVSVLKTDQWSAHLTPGYPILLIPRCFYSDGSEFRDDVPGVYDVQSQRLVHLQI